MRSMTRLSRLKLGLVLGVRAIAGGGNLQNPITSTRTNMSETVDVDACDNEVQDDCDDAIVELETAIQAAG